MHSHIHRNLLNTKTLIYMDILILKILYKLHHDVVEDHVYNLISESAPAVNSHGWTGWNLTSSIPANKMRATHVHVVWLCDLMKDLCNKDIKFLPKLSTTECPLRIFNGTINGFFSKSLQGDKSKISFIGLNKRCAMALRFFIPKSREYTLLKLVNYSQKYNKCKINMANTFSYVESHWNYNTITSKSATITN